MFGICTVNNLSILSFVLIFVEIKTFDFQTLKYLFAPVSELINILLANLFVPFSCKHCLLHLS